MAASRTDKHKPARDGPRISVDLKDNRRLSHSFGGACQELLGSPRTLVRYRHQAPDVNDQIGVFLRPEFRKLPLDFVESFGQQWAVGDSLLQPGVPIELVARGTAIVVGVGGGFIGANGGDQGTSLGASEVRIDLACNAKRLVSYGSIMNI